MRHGFRHRFAFQSHGGEWGDGPPPPWMQQEHHSHHGHHRHHGHHGPPFGPRFWARRIGRGLFGRGGFFGEERQQRFGRGDVKYALLELLQERPMHGYEMMKALEDRSGGFYSPSAGTIYPTLQMLEDRGFVTSAESDGKRVYSITDAGRQLLAEQQKEEEEYAGWWGGFGPRQRWNAPEMQAFRSEAMEVARLFAIAGRMSFRDTEQLKRLRGVLERARKDLTDIIYGSETSSATGSAETAEPKQD